MIVYLDMDGVLANIHEKIGVNTSYSETPKEILEEGFYEGLSVMKGAKDFVKWCESFEEIDLYVATKTPRGNIFAASEKLHWINNLLPELREKVFITPNKLLLKGDFLIDDDLRWKDFGSGFIHFSPRNPLHSWKKAREEISKKLKNSRDISLDYSYSSGLILTNNSKTEISSISVKIAQELKSFSNIPSKGSVIILKIDIPETNWTVNIKSLTWKDGAIEKNFKLSSSKRGTDSCGSRDATELSAEDLLESFLEMTEEPDNISAEERAEFYKYFKKVLLEEYEDN